MFCAHSAQGDERKQKIKDSQAKMENRGEEKQELDQENQVEDLSETNEDEARSLPDGLRLAPWGSQVKCCKPAQKLLPWEAGGPRWGLSITGLLNGHVEPPSKQSGLNP